jgi:hypothetical protein
MRAVIAGVLVCTVSASAAIATTLAVTMSADDAFEAFVSTDDAVEGAQFLQGTSWSAPQSGEVTLTPGVVHYLHVRARDVFGAPSMLVATLTLDDEQFAFGNGLQVLHTDVEHWTLSLTGFGTDPMTPVDLGQHGTQVWGLLAGIDASARHIWSAQTTGEHYFSVVIAPTDGVTTTTSTTTTTTTVSVATSTSTSTSTTTLPDPTALFPPGKKLLVIRKRSGRERLIALAGPPDVAIATPCETDGELVLEPAGATARRFPLEAGLWKPLNRNKPERGCRYRKGPVVAMVLIKPNRVLKVIAASTDLGIPLSTDPRPVRLEVRHGDVRHCLEFGGAKGQHKPDKKLLAKQAPPATTCPDDVS